MAEKQKQKNLLRDPEEHSQSSQGSNSAKKTIQVNHEDEEDDKRWSKIAQERNRKAMRQSVRKPT